jgi:glycerol uptake operon antiterminator
MSDSNLTLPPVIPALRSLDLWQDVHIKTGPNVVFILGGSINTVAEPVALLERRGWRVFLHVDMLKGLTTDADGLRFLADYVGPAGIISTHAHTIQTAKKNNLIAIQRLFVVDSQSVETGINQARTAKPDAVELMPGLIPQAIRQISHQLSCPVIAGGLVTDEEHVRQALAAGACSVSTSNAQLWQWAIG